MKLSLILLFLKVHFIYAHPIFFFNNTGDGLNSKRDDAQRDSTQLALHRQRRDAIGKNLEATVTHLQQTARITNAIALQQGLAAGSININTLIPELLIFGPVTLDEIFKLDGNLPNTLASLKDLPTKISGSEKVKNFEEYFIAVNSILTAFDGFDNLSEWKGRSDFTDDLDKLIRKDVDMNFISDMSYYLRKFYNSELYKIPNATANITDEQLQQFKDLHGYSQKLIELSSQEFPNPVFFKNNNSAFTAFSGVTRLIDAFDVYQSKLLVIKFIIQGSDKEIEQSLTAISTFSSNISAIGPIEVLQRLFAWKLSPSSFRSIKFTSGLPNGYSDIDEIFIDFNSPFVTSKLEIALGPLKDLEKNAMNLNRRLDANVLKDSEQVTLLLNKLKALNQVTSDIPAIMNASAALERCVQNLQRGPYDPGKLNIIEKVKKLDDQIAMTRQFIKKSHQMLIKQLLTNVDGYYLKASAFQPFFDCLRNEKNRDLVFSTVSISKYLRENVTEFNGSIDKVAGVAKKVIDTKEDLKAMDSTLKKMKGMKSPEVDALKLFSDAQKHSNAIGGATQGVVSMTKAIKEKDNLVAGFGLVEEGMTKIGWYSKNSTFSRDLESLLSIKGEIEQLYASLGQFSNEVKDVKVTAFQDLSAIFPDAQKVTGIKSDFVEIGESVGELADKINDTSSPELRSLQLILNSMDLDFSKHHNDFADSGVSLHQLDLFLAKFNKAFDPVTTTPSPISPPKTEPQSAPAAAAPPCSKWEDKWFSKPEKQTSTLLISFIWTVVTVAIVACGYCVANWSCKIGGNRQRRPDPAPIVREERDGGNSRETAEETNIESNEGEVSGINQQLDHSIGSSTLRKTSSKVNFLIFLF